MKKNLLFAILAAIFLVACTANQDLSTGKKGTTVRRTQNNTPNEYEGLYQTLISTTLPEILSLEEFEALMDGSAEVDMDDTDAVFAYVSEVIDSYSQNGYIRDIFDVALVQNNIILDWNNEFHVDDYVIDSLVYVMGEEKYLTLASRLEVFENGTLNNDEKYVLCLSYAVNNFVYDALYGKTAIVIDGNNNYITMQLDESPIDLSLPWNLCEIMVDDIEHFEESNILSYPCNEITFSSHAEREAYLHDIHEYYSQEVTIQECDAIYAAHISQLELELSAGVLGYSPYVFIDPYGYAGAVTVLFIAYLAQVAYYKIEHKQCVNRATQNNPNNQNH